MAVGDSTLAFLTEVLEPLGRITSKRLFGGAAFYCDGTVFALFLRDALYLKADPADVAAFKAEGCGPFNYDTKQGSRVVTSYWRAPERLYDEPDEFREWARRALATSRAAPEKRRVKRSTAAKRAAPRRSAR